MKRTINLIAHIIFFIIILLCVNNVSSEETYRYEGQNFFGLDNRIIPKPRLEYVKRFNPYEYPDPLPSTVLHAPLATVRSLYQGLRGKNDTRIFRRKFEYEAKEQGQHVLCEGMFDCVITFLAVESTEAIPVILRGGVGYKHFTAIVKAKPERELKGQVRAYCKRQGGAERE